MDAAQKLVLDRQVRELHDHRKNEASLASEEAAMLRQQCDLEREEAKRIEELRAQMAARAHEELHGFNKLKRSQLQESVNRERTEDAERLAAKLAEERAAEEREIAAKEAMQAETKLFADHMLAQKRELNRQEAEQEAERQKALDKAWEKRLAVWGAEQEARERLMAQVLDERRLQVMTKLENEQIAKQKAADDRHTLENELARINALETDKAANARQTRYDHRSLLEMQIKEKTFKKAASDFNKTQERAAAERAESHYQAMLSDQMSRTQSQMDKYTVA